MSAINLLSIPPELLSPILKYVVEGEGNLRSRLICTEMKDVVDLHVIPYLWRKLKENAGQITAIDLKGHIIQIETNSPDEISLTSFRALYQKIHPKDQFKYIPVLLSQFLEIKAKLLDESLLEIWSELENHLPEDRHGLKSALAIRSYLNNPENALALESVAALPLRIKKLKVIPPEINRFEKIKTINLSNNEIGSLINFSSNLTDLHLFVLNDNQVASLVGLSALTNLKYLYLSDNQVTSLVGLSALTKLHTLHFDNNRVTSLVDLSTLTNLQRLHFSNNQVTSLVGLSALTNLAELRITGNQILPEESEKLAGTLKNTKIEK